MIKSTIMNPHETLPTRLKNYIKKEKIHISYLNLKNVLGFLYIKNIGINKNVSFYKKRFAIAHETGHYFYGDQFTLPGVAHWKSPEEKRADDFALRTLLPQDRLLEEFIHHEGDLTILEKIFGVEMFLIEKRLKQILLLKN